MPKIAEIEFTPNPNAKRFVLKEPITTGTARSYDSSAGAADDPLARELFAIPHVTEVYYVDRYLTVVQDGAAAWSELERALAVPIRAADAQALQKAFATPAAAKLSPDDLSELDRGRLERINALLDERVRPALMMDGGGLEVVGFSGNTLQIHYMGACGTCPSSITGTMAGIEALLQTIEPALQVVAV
ncbi:MAG: NifU family protein [Candidatus Sericytochromatia bacterium]|nr:NifU family protein [Candidatus Sericytochromatia bacterium]